jgi:excisionase family DNA binding protein
MDAGRQRAKIADLDGRDFARVTEVADIFEVDNRTIRSRIADGLIPATKMGSEYRIPVRWVLQEAGVGGGGLMKPTAHFQRAHQQARVAG